MPILYPKDQVALRFSNAHNTRFDLMIDIIL